MKTVLRKISYYFGAIFDHLYSNWYKIFLGEVGKGSVIRRHCSFAGNAIGSISFGVCCDIDSYCVLEAYHFSSSESRQTKPIISIGNNCIFGQYTHLTAVKGITIGDNLLTGRFVLITDNSHGSFTKEELAIHPSNRKVMSKGEVIIGKNVWIGDKVSILPGVHIGDGCVIGANTVVTHNIPPYSLVVGNPGKIIKTLD